MDAEELLDVLGGGLGQPAELPDVAASDADIDPTVAAERLADWLNAVDRDADCFLYDLMAGGVIPW